MHITEHSLYIRKDYNIFNDVIFGNCKLNEAVVDPMAQWDGIAVFPIARVNAHRIHEGSSYNNLVSSILLGVNGYSPWIVFDCFLILDTISSTNFVLFWLQVLITT